jgi:hypothetical protein
MGEPWSAADLRAQAEEISGKTVGKNWNRKFEKRHPEIRAAKPAKLDPKRAKHFNEEVIGLLSTFGTGTRRVFRWGEDGRRAARNIIFSRTRNTVIVSEVTISSSLPYLNVYPLQEKLFLLAFVFKMVQDQIFERSQMMNGEGLKFLFHSSISMC